MNITPAQINAYLDQKLIQEKTKGVYKSVLENLQTFAMTYPTENQAEILNRFLNQPLSPKARVMYNSISNDFLNYKAVQDLKTEFEAKTEATVEIVEQIQEEIEAEEIVEPQFISEEIDFNRVCNFDINQYYVKTEPRYMAIGSELVKTEMIFNANKHVVIKGKAGVGKTTIAIKFAKDKNLPLIKIACSEGMRSDDLVGSVGIDTQDGKMKFNAGLLSRAVLIANKIGKCVIVLDEINVLKPQIQKNLISFLDETRFLDIADYGRLTINEGVKILVFGTMNYNYAGTNELNPEIESRFGFIQLGEPTKAQQEKILSVYKVEKSLITKVIDLTAQINRMQEAGDIDGKKVFSTREQLTFLSLIASGLKNGQEKTALIKNALELAFIDRASEKPQQEKIRETSKYYFGV